MRRLGLDQVKYQIVLGLLGVLLTGCGTLGWGAPPTPTLGPSLVDSSILTGVPCTAPCWYGLEIGRSTKSEILATVQTLSFVDPKSFSEEPDNYWDPSKRANLRAMSIHLKCRQPEGQPCASLLVFDDVLRRIDLSPPPGITLGQAVAHLGPPEFVKVYPINESAVLCNVALIWKQRGIWVAFRNDPYQRSLQKEQVRCQDVRAGHGVSAGLPVGQLIYESPDELADVPIPGADFPWSGFGKP